MKITSPALADNRLGDPMRFGLKYPDLFSVVAAAGGEWDNSPEVWPTDVERIRSLKEMPREISDLDDVTNWWVQMAAAAAPDLDNPPFYAEMPFRIVDGHGEFVPEVVAKIIDLDSVQEARRYLQQPVRLRGIRIQHGKSEHSTRNGHRCVHRWPFCLASLRLGVIHPLAQGKRKGRLLSPEGRFWGRPQQTAYADNSTSGAQAQKRISPRVSFTLGAEKRHSL